MANRYVRAAGGNSNVAATYASTSGGTDTVALPTASDDIFCDSLSGNFAIAAALSCRSLDQTGWTGTQTNTSNVIVTIGTSTAGPGNVAIKLASGATYTITASLFVVLASTSATVQTITSNGKTAWTQINVNGSGSSYQLADALTLTGVLVVSMGTFDGNSKAISCTQISSTGASTRSITLTSSAVTITGTVPVNVSGSGITWSATGATLTANFSGAITWTSNVTLGCTVVISAATTIAFSAGINCTTLTTTHSAIKGNTITTATGASSIVVSGTATFGGNSVTNRVKIQSATINTAAQCSFGTLVANNCNFRDIQNTGTTIDISAATGMSGDCGGNSGFTFTPPATQGWNGTNSGSASTNSWTTRVPLPQDPIVMATAFAASAIITSDMPDIGKSIDWSGSTINTALTWSKTVATTIYGDITMLTGMVNSGAANITVEKRTTPWTYDGKGQTLSNPLLFPLQTKLVVGTSSGGLIAAGSMAGGMSP